MHLLGHMKTSDEVVEAGLQKDLYFLVKDLAENQWTNPKPLETHVAPECNNYSCRKQRTRAITST